MKKNHTRSDGGCRLEGQINGQKTKNNRIYIRILAAFFIIIIFFTFFSKTIYNYSLPEAAVAFPMQGELKHDIKGSGDIAYKNTWGVFAEEDGRISEIRIAQGDWVNKGDVLMVLKKSGEEGNIEVQAPKSGRILSVGIQEGTYVSAMQNEPLVQMAEFSGQWIIELAVDEELAANIDIGCQSILEIPGILGEISGNVVSVKSVKREGYTEYTAVIEFACEEEGIGGKRAQVTIQREGEVYNGILPNYALHKDEKGYYVWTVREESNILGNHYVVYRLSVDLLDEDGEVVAVLGIVEGMPVIISCTKELQEGERISYEESDES